MLTRLFADTLFGVYMDDGDPMGGTLNEESEESTDQTDLEETEADAEREPGDTEQEATENDLPESIPYARFKEVNDELKRERQEREQREKFIAEILETRKPPKETPEGEAEEEWEYASPVEEMLHQEVKGLKSQLAQAVQFVQNQHFAQLVNQADATMKSIEREFKVKLTDEQKQQVFKDAFPYIQNGVPLEKQIERSYKYLFIDDIIKRHTEEAEAKKVEARKKDIGDRPSGSSAKGGVEEFDDLQAAVRAALKGK